MCFVIDFKSHILLPYTAVMVGYSSRLISTKQCYTYSLQR